MRPILACDIDLDKVRYPVMLFPKIDGVRGLNISDRLVGRSGKQFKNKLNTEFFSDPRFNGFDGEMVIDRITGYGICNEVTSALATIKGSIETRWCLFDYVVEGENHDEPYIDRYERLRRVVRTLVEDDPSLELRIWVIPYIMAYCRDDIEAYEFKCLLEGYEGIIARAPDAPYKFGRGTVKEGYYLRLKRFIEAEIEVTHVAEGMSNLNELKANPHGYAERSTSAGGMVPNGMVGTIYGTALEDVTFNERVVIEKGQTIEVAPGKMSHPDRRFYLENPDQIRGKIAKYQFFPIGIKDKPRFPTFQCFRDPVDMG